MDYSWFTISCQFQVYSKVIKLYIYLFFSNDFPIRFIQNIQQSSLCYTIDICWFKYNNAYMSIPNSQFLWWKKLSRSSLLAIVHPCIQLSSVQSLSLVRLFVTPWTAARQASLSITNSWSLLKLMSIELVMPSNHLILCCPLLFLPSIFPSVRVFHKTSVFHIRWPKYWSFSFSMYTRQYYYL